MSDRDCTLCRFAEPAAEGPFPQHPTCRRFPPQQIRDHTWGWPPAFPGVWCHEFQPRSDGLRVDGWVMVDAASGDDQAGTRKPGSFSAVAAGYDAFAKAARATLFSTAALNHAAPEVNPPGEKPE